MSPYNGYKYCCGLLDMWPDVLQWSSVLPFDRALAFLSWTLEMYALSCNSRPYALTAAISNSLWVLQIVFIILYDSGSTSLSDSVATKVYQAVRVIRLVRFTSLLRRLYATAAVAQSSLLPGVHVSHPTISWHLPDTSTLLSGFDFQWNPKQIDRPVLTVALQENKRFI